MIKISKLSLHLPFGIGGIELEPDEQQEKIAWTLYVELVTRVAVQPLDEKSGSLREVLDSLYAVFKLTREVLRDAGPGVAKGPNSLGPLAIAVLNQGLRPFMSKWHPCLAAHEAARPEGTSPIAHERTWEFAHEMRQELAQLQKDLRIYADGLASIAGAK